jgi:hypothetical protein
MRLGSAHQCIRRSFVEVQVARVAFPYPTENILPRFASYRANAHRRLHDQVMRIFAVSRVAGGNKRYTGETEASAVYYA